MITRRSVFVAAFVLGVGLCAPALLAQAPARLIAVGDIHGAYDQFVTILTQAGLIDAGQKWTGGNATFVQTGDFTDRGAKVREVLDLLMALEDRARAGGGQMTTLLGNHEVLNIIGDLRYVTPEICAAFADADSENRRAAAWKQYQSLAAARARARTTVAPVYQQTREAWMAVHPPGWLEYREALGPKGKYGRWLRSKSVAAVIGGSLFMHAGINPNQTIGADAANTQARAEMERFEKFLQRLVDAKLALPFFTLPEVIEVSNAELLASSVAVDEARAKGEMPDLTEFNPALLREATEILKLGNWSILAAEGPLWFRGYANWTEDETTRAKVFGFLDKVGLTRIVVGHTPTADGRIAARFSNRVLVIDTGMLTPVYRGRPAALEIRGPELRAIYEDGVVPLSPATAAANLAAR